MSHRNLTPPPVSEWHIRPMLLSQSLNSSIPSAGKYNRPNFSVPSPNSPCPMAEIPTFGRCCNCKCLAQACPKNLKNTSLPSNKIAHLAALSKQDALWTVQTAAQLTAFAA